MPDSGFLYEPLDSGQIRLLTLQPGRFGSPLTADFKTISLSDLIDCAEAVALSLATDNFEGSLKIGWTFRLEDGGETAVALLHHPDIQLAEPVEASIDLGGCLGNDNGAFDPSDRNFHRTARDIGLDGTTLTASLQAISGEWRPGAIDIRQLFLRSSDCIAALQQDITCALAGYEALSYCWGEQVFPKALHLNDRHSVAITKHLYQALQHLRRDDSERRLWVDAVSINQKDLEEKGNQVALMDQIYSFASQTIVWLGQPFSEIHNLAFATLTADLDKPHHTEDIPSFLDLEFEKQPLCRCCGESIGLTKPSGTDGLIATTLLLQRPWFSRLWVIQEVVLPPRAEVYCGFHHAPFSKLVKATSAAWMLHVSTQISMESPLDPTRTWLKLAESLQFVSRMVNVHKRDKKRQFTISDYLTSIFTLSRRQCREPHDRVYAVLRLYGRHGFGSIHPDYTLPVAELFRRVTKICLSLEYTDRSDSQSTSPTLLLALKDTERLHEGSTRCLSWVPDLHSLSDRSRVKWLNYAAGVNVCCMFRSDNEAFKCCFVEGDQDRVSIRGRCFARVDRIFEDSQCPLTTFEEEAEFIEHPSENECIALIQWFTRCREFLLLHGDLPAIRQFYHQRERDLTNTVQPNVRGTNTLAYPSLDTEVEEAEKEVNTVISDDSRFGLESDLVDYEAFSQLVGHLSSGSPDHRYALDARSMYIGLRPFLQKKTTRNLDRMRNICCASSEFGSLRLAGRVPLSVRVGDYACYFTGAPYPFMLRLREDGSFRLLGDAFFRGIQESDILQLDLERYKDVTAELHMDPQRTGWPHHPGRRNSGYEEMLEMYYTACDNIGWISLS